MSLDEISESPSGRLVAQLGELVGNSAGGLHEPLFEGNEKSYVAECIETAYVSSVGSFVARFENDLAQYVGAPHAIAVVNGTSALHLALVGVVEQRAVNAGGEGLHRRVRLDFHQVFLLLGGLAVVDVHG